METLPKVLIIIMIAGLSILLLGLILNGIFDLNYRFPKVFPLAVGIPALLAFSSFCTYLLLDEDA